MTDRKDWLEPLRERARKLEEETKQIRARTVKLRNRIAARLKDVEAPNGDWLRNYPLMAMTEDQIEMLRCLIKDEVAAAGIDEHGAWGWAERNLDENWKKFQESFSENDNE